MPSSYRSRDALSRARGIAARQFREFPDPLDDLGHDDLGHDDLGHDDLDDDLDGPEGGQAAGGPLGEWRRRVADRTPPGVRAARVRVDPRAAVGVFLIGLLVAAVLGFWAWRSWPAPAGDPGQALPERSGPVAAGVPAAASSVPTASAASAASAAPTVVVVHVAGRVAAPGVVTLPVGSRVSDALTAVGGAAPDADLDAVNLARVLVDGEQVLVPGPGEVPPAPAGNQGASAAPGPVNLNTASATDLDELPGVGEVLAGRIVAWRETNGNFTSVEDLGEVQGIGPKVLEDLRDLVTV
ncbi:helix-hairpin-helix domain-containing protein [Kineococcus sp. SYSU DK003]|uniref:helix-hairpin-helix domain-containing protein n=1 Tax=Kineococcus sp. SYSU DK003 TaxID=3383124 RepID=UPI003D7C6CF5